MRMGKKISPWRQTKANVEDFVSPEKMALPVAEDVWARDETENIASAIIVKKTGKKSLESPRDVVIMIASQEILNHKGHGGTRRSY
jgi:hypothetical protein